MHDDAIARLEETMGDCRGDVTRATYKYRHQDDRESTSVGGVKGPIVRFLSYPPAMVPPRWPDEQGRPMPTYPMLTV